MRQLLLLFLLLCAVATPAAAQTSHSGTLSDADQKTLQRAIQDYQKGRYIPSAKQLRILAARHPSNPDIQFFLGLNAVKHNFNVAGIRRYFPQVLRLDPSYPDPLAHYYMGLIHYTDNQFDQAVDDFTRYFQLANTNGTPESDATYMEASNYLYWSRFLAEAYRNIAPFHPRVITSLSSSEDETMPFFSLDGSLCIFLRPTSTASRASFHSHELDPKPLKLYLSARHDTLFSPPTLLPAPFNQGDPEGGVTLTADNRELYYPVIRRFRGYNNSDIYLSTFDSNRWQPVRNLGDSVNRPDTWESQPSISPDGQWLYFASNRPGGLGGTDIWRSRRKPDGSWGTPVNLGSAVNSPGNERCPFIHADGHTLYFSSNGWQTFGGYDLFFIDLDRTDLAIPANLGLPINTESDDITLSVSPDGIKAHLAAPTDSADRIGGSDILQFNLYPAARPEPMHLIKGRVTSTGGTPLPATITVDHGTTHPAIYRTAPDGTYAILISKSKNNTVTISAPGHKTRALPCTPSNPLPSTLVLSPQ